MAQKLNQKDDFEPDDFEPEMTFAIVNGVKVPLGGDTSDYPEINSSNEITQLTSDEEGKFKNWIATNKISDLDHPDSHYDYRGYWKEFGDKPIKFGVDHFTDTYKQHGHPTFSVESKYSQGDGGHWEGDKFIPADDFEKDDFESDAVSKPELTRSEPSSPSLMQRLMTPLVDVSPQTRQNLDWFQQQHPVIGKIGNTTLDMMLSESSPLSLGLGGLGAGESVAAGLGYDKLASLLKFPSRAAGGAMVWHGLGNVGSGEGLGEKLGGGIEALLGGLAIRGPKLNLERPKSMGGSAVEPAIGDVLDTEARRLQRPMSVPDVQAGTPPFNTNQFGLSAQSSPLDYPNNVIPDRLRPPGTNATVFDALVPEQYKSRIGEAPPTLSRGNTLEQAIPQPSPLERPVPISIEDKSFYDRIKEFISDESGELRLPRIKPDEYRRGSKDNFEVYNTNDMKHHSWWPTKELAERVALKLEKMGNPEYDFREVPRSEPGKLVKFIKDESGEAKFPNLGTRRHPLRALDELHDALMDAAEKRESTDILAKAEKSKRFRDVEEVQTQGRKGMYERLSKLKGELPKAEFEPVSINPDSARALYNEIQRSDLKTPEKIRASVALGKILGDYGEGKVPQRNEIELLRRVFGDPIADSLTQMHSGIPLGVSQLNEVANLSKSLMASYDMSAPFRQGLGLIHTKEFWKNYSKMFSYLGKDAYNVAMKSINEHPMYEPLRKAGLQITEIGSDLGAREEQFASRIAEHIPGIPASERMYTGFLNKTRFDVAKRLMDEAEKSGLKPFIRDSAGEMIPTKLGREITKFVNTATGRGSLGRFEKNAVELNSLFFSPRLISSRLTMLNPSYYIKADPFVRKQALKSLFAMATAGKIVEELGKAAGGTVDTDDPTSTDYHKVKIGNTRLDPYGGYQQYVVAANRLLAGAYNSYMNEEDGIKLKTAFSRTLGVGGRFGSFTENKLSPLVKFADDLLSGRPSEDRGVGNLMNLAGIEHKPFTAQVINQFTPMIVQDLADLMKEDPSLIPLSLLGASGMGVQTYGSQSDQNNTGFRELVR